MPAGAATRVLHGVILPRPIVRAPVLHTEGFAARVPHADMPELTHRLPPSVVYFLGPVHHLLLVLDVVCAILAVHVRAGTLVILRAAARIARALVDQRCTGHAAMLWGACDVSLALLRAIVANF